MIKSIRRPTQQASVMPEESWGQTIGRNISSIASRAGRGFEDLFRQSALQSALLNEPLRNPAFEKGTAQFFANLLGKPVPEQYRQEPLPLSQRTENIKQAYAQMPHLFNPEPARNPIEEYAQGMAADIPLALLSGGTSALAPLATGHLARVGLQEAGASPLTQTLGQIGTELLTGRFTQKQAPKTLKGFIKEEAETARKIAPQAVEVAPEMGTAFKLANRQAQTTATKGTKEEIHAIEKAVDNLITKNKADPLMLWELQSDMYKNYPYLDFHTQPVSTSFTQAIGKTLEKSGIEHPEFWQHVDAAKQGTAFNNMQTGIGWFIDKAFSLMPLKNKYVKMVKTIGKKPLEWIERQFIEQPYSLVFNKHPEVRKYYIKMATAAAAQNKGNFIKDTQNLIHAVDKAKEEDKKAPKKLTIRRPYSS